MSKQYAKDPLLYIQQPTRRSPKAKMQSTYTTKRKKDNQHLLSKEASKKKLRKKHVLPHTQVEIDEYEYPEVQEDNRILDEEEEEVASKRFSELTIEEKVDYFIKRPRFAPEVKCEVRTAEKKYKGVIIEKEEDQVIMRVGNRKSKVKILRNDITDIQLIGF